MEAQGKETNSLASRGYSECLTCSLFLHLHISSLQPLFPCHISLTLTLLSPSYKDPCSFFWSPQIIQDNLSQDRSLTITSTKSFLPCKVTYWQAWGIRTSLWGPYSAYHRRDLQSVLMCKHIILSVKTFAKAASSKLGSSWHGYC